MRCPATATRKAAQNTVAMREAITRPIASRPLQVVDWAAVGDVTVELSARTTGEAGFDTVAVLMRHPPAPRVGGDYAGHFNHAPPCSHFSWRDRHIAGADEFGERIDCKAVLIHQNGFGDATRLGFGEKAERAALVGG
jgi:hypothetical protein